MMEKNYNNLSENQKNHIKTFNDGYNKKANDLQTHNQLDPYINSYISKDLEKVVERAVRAVAIEAGLIKSNASTVLVEDTYGDMVVDDRLKFIAEKFMYFKLASTEAQALTMAWLAINSFKEFFIKNREDENE